MKRSRVLALLATPIGEVTNCSRKNMPQSYLVWFILAALLFVGELFSGTFFMLVLAAAFLAGGFCAFLGLSVATQCTASALLAMVGFFVLKNRKRVPHAHPNMLDVGQTVVVVTMGADPTKLRVKYRGAEWDAQIAEPYNQQHTLYITDVRGSTLVLGTQKPRTISH